ncbi:MAG: hypothetical protein M1821_007330 [Bathelium mastoideum]|nr:MAG: hypothetical protein M1821_007330 [Bathelium mastoideum]
MPDVVGLVALSITCLNGCVQGLIVLSKAKHYNRDVSDVQLRTELTLHSLTTWAEEAGLMQDPPTLLMSANKAALVPKILSQLETLLRDLNELEQRYGLFLQPTSEEVENLDDDAITLIDTTSSRREFTKRAADIFHRRKEPWKRLRWVTFDDKRLERLLEKVKSYISEMEKFLEQAKQERRDRYVEFCLREAILNTSRQQELDIIVTEFEEAPSRPAIAAAARFKQARLMLGFSDGTFDGSNTTLSKSLSSSSIYEVHQPSTSSTGNSEPKYMKLSMRLLTLSRSARAQRLRTLAQYDGRTVLLEWKNVSGMTDLTISRRVNQVATLLQDLGPSFHSLKCLGFVKDHFAKRYGYIFHLSEELGLASNNSRAPTPNTYALQPTPELRSLRQMLDQVSMPSLNMRLSLAGILLETLLNLHTSGWLHKDFRSDNVILIRRTSRIPERTGEELSAYSTYVVGYIHSRADSPGEMTESLKSDIEADLYRHPSSLGESRQSYSKSLDIFSVGCILLEIGLWSSLQQILLHHSKIRSSIAVSSLPTRSVSDPTQVHSNAFEQSDDEEEGETEKKKTPIDLMKLKDDLLLSHLMTHRPKLETLTAASRSTILAYLEAAMGRKYSSIVEEFIAAGSKIKETKANEHEFALDVETRARDTIRAIRDAV